LVIESILIASIPPGFTGTVGQLASVRVIAFRIVLVFGWLTATKSVNADQRVKPLVPV